MLPAPSVVLPVAGDSGVCVRRSAPGTNSQALWPVPWCLRGHQRQATAYRECAMGNLFATSCGVPFANVVQNFRLVEAIPLQRVDNNVLKLALVQLQVININPRRAAVNAN